MSLQDHGAVQGAAELAAAVGRARDAGATVRILAAVRVRVDERRLAARAIDGALAGLGLPCARVSIPLAAAFDTAAAAGRPLTLRAPDSRGAARAAGDSAGGRV